MPFRLRKKNTAPFDGLRGGWHHVLGIAGMHQQIMLHHEIVPFELHGGPDAGGRKIRTGSMPIGEMPLR